jgi:hypothetical protein
MFNSINYSRRDVAADNVSFAIKIDFNKDTESPSLILSTLSELVDIFQRLDRALIKTIPVDLEPIVLLEDLEYSSIKLWLKNIFKKSSDSELIEYDPNKISNYLNESRFAIVNFAERTTTITNNSFDKVQEEIYESLSRINPTQEMPIYTEIPKKEIISTLQGFQKSIQPLNSEDKVTFMTDSGKVASLRTSFDFSPENLEDVLTSEIIENTNIEILKIKKPDYLGSSQWEFMGERVFLAKISDMEWIQRFHSRDFSLGPGDGIKAEVKTIVKYDWDNNVIASKREITKVIEVIYTEKNQNLTIFDINPSEG